MIHSLYSALMLVNNSRGLQAHSRKSTSSLYVVYLQWLCFIDDLQEEAKSDMDNASAKVYFSLHPIT